VILNYGTSHFNPKVLARNSYYYLLTPPGGLVIIGIATMLVIKREAEGFRGTLGFKKGVRLIDNTRIYSTRCIL